MATLLLNPACARGDAYPAELRALLSVEGARRAHASVYAWPGYAATPLVPLPQLAARLGVASLLVKDEGRRFSVGSFKALGGALAVLRAVEGARPAAVACATDGNHGRAVAWGAQRAGVAAFVFVHSTVSEARADAIASFGATVVREGATYDDAVRACAAAAARHGWCLISDTAAASPDGATAFDAATVCVTQGYSVVALEIDEAGERPTHVFVQAGVGGLAAGLLSYRWERFGTHRPVMTVVEPERAACCFASALAGALVSVGGPLDTLCAGLACGEPSALAWRVLARGCDAFMTITDECVAFLFCASAVALCIALPGVSL